MSAPGLSRVCLTIASFRHDPAVIRLLEQAHSAGASPFQRIIVVDSLGTGAVLKEIRRRGWKDVDYLNEDNNLGSAGNLRRRLQRAAQLGADYAYAINHDGRVDLDLIDDLVHCADQIDGVGAVYPLHYYSRRKAYDRTGTSSLPIPFIGQSATPTGTISEVNWSSSNGALYALDPARAGHLPDHRLWMGWEDMAYGWELARQGYRQILVHDSIFNDDYEYRPVKVLGRTLYLTDKPAWYTYYQIRNLLLIAGVNPRPTAAYATVLTRIALEVGLVALARPDKLTRLNYLAAGLVDGLLRRHGKWKVP